MDAPSCASSLKVKIAPPPLILSHTHTDLFISVHFPCALPTLNPVYHLSLYPKSKHHKSPPPTLQSPIWNGTYLVVITLHSCSFSHFLQQSYYTPPCNMSTSNIIQANFPWGLDVCVYNPYDFFPLNFVLWKMMKPVDSVWFRNCYLPHSRQIRQDRCYRCS